MGRRQKAPKLTRKKDQLVELPDGVLFKIISLLSLKDAVKMSVLSKQWRFIWTWHADLLFDCAGVLGNQAYYRSKFDSKLDRQLRCKFAERVNQIMYLRCKGTKVDSFGVHFHLGKEFAPLIDQWISNAIRMGVENVDLDLSDSCCDLLASPTVFEYYKFPCSLLTASEINCSVKHLQLVSCSLSDLPGSNSLNSLITVHLQDVDVSDQKLENLLSSCSFLESLSLRVCIHLVNLKIAGPNLKLKHLSIQCCLRLERMELCANNLVSFEYTGHLISFNFKNVPRLAEAFLEFIGESRLDGGTYSLTRFVCDLPQLETLNCVSVLSMKSLKLPEDVYTFSSIKQLVLTIFPFHDEDDLCWISYVLRAFPLLQKLELNLLCPSYIKEPKAVERVLPERPHQQLRELEINGFYGNHHEVELLKYLLHNLVELRVLSIGPCQKLYRGFKDCVYEGRTSWDDDTEFRLESVYDWLNSVVPPSVQLQIW